MPHRGFKGTVAQDFGLWIFHEQIPGELLMHTLIIRIQFRICENNRKITCTSAVGDNANAASALSERALSHHQRYDGISVVENGAKSDLQRQHDVSISAVSISADADLALSLTAQRPN